MARRDRQASGRDSGPRPHVFPLDLFPRARRRSLRTRDGPARIRPRRAHRIPGRGTSHSRLVGVEAQHDRTKTRFHRFAQKRPARRALHRSRYQHMSADPHKDGPVLQFGKPLAEASGAVILLHGRGGTAEDILSLANEFYVPSLAYLAPQAAANSWYPNSFLAPILQNEPWLPSALRKVQTTIDMVNARGIPTNRIVIG